MTLHDRPSAGELVAAVREYLERDVMPATEGRVAFHARVAVNVLGMVERCSVSSNSCTSTVAMSLKSLVTETSSCVAGTFSIFVHAPSKSMTANTKHEKLRFILRPR